MTDLSEVEALTFDIGGTVFDVSAKDFPELADMLLA